MHVRSKKVELSVIPGTLNYFCWGLCYSASVFVSLDSIDIRAGATDKSDFSGHYACQDTIGFALIRYVFYDQDHPSDTVCVNVKYDTRPLGIDNNLLKNNTKISAYPNPANNAVSFVYKISEGTTSSIFVRNLLGSLVKEINLNNAEGKIILNTSDLSDGVYFYSIIENGFSISTRKLIVKH